MEGLKNQFLQWIHTKKLEVPNEATNPHVLITPLLSYKTLIVAQISHAEKSHNGVIS